jgi:tetratricopeptide (TPR) repeat protein
VEYRLELGDLEAAAANAAEALTIIGDNFVHDSISYAVALHSRATAQLALQQNAAALLDATRAAGLIDKQAGPGHEFSVAAHSTAALAAALEGQLDAALQAAEQTAPHAAKLPPANAQRARAARIHGTVLRLNGDAPAAVPVLQAVAESTDPAPKWQRERMRALAQLGWAQLQQGAAAQAVDSFERAIKEFERLEVRATPARADALLGLQRARAQAARGR